MRRIAAIAAGALVLVLGCGPASAKTLAEVVRVTIASNPEIQRERALVRAADYRVDEQFAGYLPTLNIDADSGYDWSNNPSTRTRPDLEIDDKSSRQLWRTNGFVILRQMVFDGFATTNRETSAQADRLAAERRLELTAERIALRVVEVYLAVLNTTEQLRLARINEGHHAEIRDRVNERVQQGVSDRIDLDQAEARLALARSLMIRRQGDERAANARFVEFVGEPPENLGWPQAPSDKTPSDADTAIENALLNNPRVKRTAAVLDARRADIDVARASYYPRLDLEISGATGKNLDGVQGRDSNVSVMLRLTYDLFNGMFDVATVSRRSFEASAAAYADGETRRQVREETRVVYRNLYAAVARVEPLRDRVAAATRTLEGYLEQFDLGKRSLLDVLDARSELFGGQSELAEGEYAATRFHFQLYYSMGRLRQLLGLAD